MQNCKLKEGLRKATLGFKIAFFVPIPFQTSCSHILTNFEQL